MVWSENPETTLLNMNWISGTKTLQSMYRVQFIRNCMNCFVFTIVRCTQIQIFDPFRQLLLGVVGTQNNTWIPKLSNATVIKVIIIIYGSGSIFNSASIYCLCCSCVLHVQVFHLFIPCYTHKKEKFPHTHVYLYSYNAVASK